MAARANALDRPLPRTGRSLAPDRPLGDSGMDAESFVYDPANPVMTTGGNHSLVHPAISVGPFDQRSVEARADVLVYTGPVLDEPARDHGAPVGRAVRLVVGPRYRPRRPPCRRSSGRPGDQPLRGDPAAPLPRFDRTPDADDPGQCLRGARSTCPRPATCSYPGIGCASRSPRRISHASTATSTPAAPSASRPTGRSHTPGFTDLLLARRDSTCR